ncbi:protein kinase domain-containing protein [Actinoallomurus sp. CA-142502]|uniref:serine/threonine-protein kinase n=1 Tax=Actinoallomurus sp. CA-142502 TaxID=3239885 RepID=UPI003D8E45B4
MSDELRESDPRRIAGYVVKARLGAGGMGVVYLAQDGAGNPVAVKVIRPELLERGKDADLSRFRREIAALRRLDRFCTARLIGADPEAEPPYLVTEFVSGPTLKEAVHRDGPLRGSDLETVAIGIAAALRHIHAAGITHRDLKPGNVLLSPYGPRVIDFGLALHDEITQRVTSEFAVGTPGYMAPEQLRAGEVGAPADVFAWGAVTAFAATGRPPFGTGGPQAVGFRVLGGEADLDGLEGALRAVVTSALAKEPARRPTSGELLERLRHLAMAPTVLATATDAPARPSVFSEPSDADGWAELARRNLDEGKAELALYQADKGIGLESHHAASHHQRGRALHGLGRESEARRALRLAHEMDSADDEISRSYARVLLEQGDEGVRKAFELAPEDDEVRRRYAESLLEWAQADGRTGALGGDHDRGSRERLDALRQAYRLLPGDEEARRRCLDALLESDEGVTTAFEIAPDDPRVKAAYVKMLVVYRVEYAEAYAIAPHDGTVADRYIRLLLAGEDRQEILDRIISMWAEATPATKAAVWEQIPDWVERQWYHYYPSASEALKQEECVGRLLALRPPEEVARRLWHIGHTAFWGRDVYRMAFAWGAIVPVWAGLSLLEIFVRHVSWPWDLLVIVVLGLMALVAAGVVYVHPGPVERRRRTAFAGAGRPYERSPYRARFPRGYVPGPDLGGAADYAEVIEPFVASRRRY